MADKIPGTLSILLPLIFMCIAINRSNACSNKCLDFWDPFKCKVTKRKCVIKTEVKEFDCKNQDWDIIHGVKFTYNITLKTQVTYICEGCCCPTIKEDLKYYQNTCPNCMKLWSKPVEKGIIKLSGNTIIMEEALQIGKFLRIRIKANFPESIVLCLDEGKTKCKLHTSNETWTIIASNQNWTDYFENSITNGYITVKKPKDQIDIKLAIQQKQLNVTQIHFVNVSVAKRTETANCFTCLTPEDFTTLPTVTSPEPSVKAGEMRDDSPYVIYHSSQRTSQMSTTTANTYVQPNLREELKSAGNTSEKRISTVAKFVGKYKTLKEDNIAVAVKELSNVTKDSTNENITKDFIDVVDHVVSTNNIDSWKNLTQKNIQPSNVMNATDSYFDGVTKHMNVGDKTKEIQKDNIILHYGSISKQRSQILNSYQISSSAIINIPQQVLQTTSENIRYTFVYYKTLSIVMKTRAIFWKEKDSQSERLNSGILSISLYPQLKYPLKKNINFALNHIKRSNLKLVCAYWNFSYKSRITGFRGRWETGGCHVVSQNQTCTTCSCNHLTNFALLMSTHSKVVNDKFTTAISLISGIISILAVIITIACYAALWPNITQNPVNRSRAIILMNLCVALIIANIVFLAGSQEYKNKVACKVISVLLHFFYLSVFFSMLMEGLDMLITVILVFSKKIKVKWLILGTWIFPLLIVGISLSINFDNYGDYNHCWLSVNNGQRWAFIGPAFFIIFINAIIFIIVISRMLRTQEMMQKTVQERIRSGIRGIALLSPILGFTWIAGFFLVHENITLQYIFIICHSLQGICIFFLHCLFSRQVREGFCQWLQKKSYFNELSNSSLKCVGLDQTNMTRTMSTAQSLDELDSYQNKLSEFRPRKSRDFLIPGK